MGIHFKILVLDPLEITYIESKETLSFTELTPIYI